ncbi:tetratricopeptide repeat-containing sulfotransferase family protein [Microbulbifer pacificus]|uniref:Sulfotransferase n=1 Tax=Microbulbifer pacificus TaxID=407164 RepID=A0AAU0MWG5_9GAMM|nr:sulfotransferase [Microbulbifer pacificus]WOX04515.1 sulfotransferase [Microbulbifer pacificus]
MEEKIKEIMSAASAGDRKAVESLFGGLLNQKSLGDKELFGAARAAKVIGEFSIAEQAICRFIDENPLESLRVVHGCALLGECGRAEIAAEYLENLLKKKSSDPSILHISGTLYQQLGRLDLSEMYLRSALEATGFRSAPTWLTLSAQVDFSSDESLFARLLSCEPKFSGLRDASGAPYFYALGKALCDRGQEDTAFDKFSVGAELLRRGRVFNAAAEKNYADRLIANFPCEEKLVACGRSYVGRSPIFIVGLPRSGTTLLEKIFSAHSLLSSGGEFGGVGLATAHLGKAIDIGAKKLSELNSCSGLDGAQEIYAQIAKKRFGESSGIVDKSINNVFYLGMIASIFPESPIIVLKRNAMDVAWSCYRTCFSQGMLWSNSMEHIASHFNIYDSLIRHWKAYLGNRLVEVEYEELVGNPKMEIPRVLSKCGLAAEGGLLDFYRNKSVEVTSSAVQVRNPIYTSSVSASKPVAHRMTGFMRSYKNIS